MTQTSTKITFLDLAKQILEQNRRPMTAPAIWQFAADHGLDKLLQSSGKTPDASLGARLFVDVQKPNSEFIKVGARPASFYLKALSTEGSLPVSSIEPSETRLTRRTEIIERDLHPLLVWFADNTWAAHCRTIFHEKSTKKSEKQNQWIHPDIVGFSLTTQDWSPEVVQLAQGTGDLGARLYSFEMKVAISFSTLREYFFQAVSNSSWAHEGYLVAVEIDDDPEFRSELTRLSQSFGIGVIQLDLTEPLDSAVLLPAAERSEIDWRTIDRVAAVNSDFREFIGAVLKSVKINQPAITGFDRQLADDEMVDYLKKTTAKTRGV